MSKPPANVPMIITYDGKDIETLGVEELRQALRDLWRHHEAMMGIYEADRQMQRLFQSRRA